MLVMTLNEDMQAAGEVRFMQDKIFRFSAHRPSVVDISGRLAPERRRVEDFIANIYRQKHEADIAVNYPTIMSVRDAQGHVFAAAGFRLAAEEPLFLEQYTGGPAELALQKIYGVKVDRSHIAEIGNLASQGGGASIFLFSALAGYLDQKGISHVVVTGTNFLHRRFIRLGLKPRKICDARLDALSGEHGHWGRYYETKPRVLAGTVADGVSSLQKALGVHYSAFSDPLYSRLHPRFSNE